jgi:hypothetical protein
VSGSGDGGSGDAVRDSIPRQRNGECHPNASPGVLPRPFSSCPSAVRRGACWTRGRCACPAAPPHSGKRVKVPLIPKDFDRTAEAVSGNWDTFAYRIRLQNSRILPHPGSSVTDQPRAEPLAPLVPSAAPSDLRSGPCSVLVIAASAGGLAAISTVLAALRQSLSSPD